MSAADLVPVATVATTTPWWVASAVLGAFITAAVALMTLIVNGRRTRADRQRILFAEAFGDLAGYREFVYIVRRRRHDEPEAERTRISTELSGLQRKLNLHSAQLKAEAPEVARTFDHLLDTTRQVAGAAIREGWNTAPITKDNHMHLEVDLTAISPAEQAYLLEVSDHLSAVPAPLLRAYRGAGAALRRRRAGLTVQASPEESMT